MQPDLHSSVRPAVAACAVRPAAALESANGTAWKFSWNVADSTQIDSPTTLCWILGSSGVCVCVHCLFAFECSIYGSLGYRLTIGSEALFVVHL